MDSFMDYCMTLQQNMGNSFISKEFLLQKHDETIEFCKVNKAYKNIYTHTDLSRPTPVLFEVVLDDDSNSDGRKAETPIRRLTPYLLFILRNESQRLEIKDLYSSVDTIHQDKYFLCRVIAAPYAMVALQLVVDSPNSEDDVAVRVALYNFTKKRQNLENLLPIGSKLVILNPFLKSTNDGGLSLTSYHAAEVAIISDDQLSSYFPELTWPDLPHKQEKQVLEKKALAMKKKGNEFLSNAKYDQAILYYTRGLKELPCHVDLLVNRSAAYLKTENYDLACMDANKALSFDSLNIKATFRLAKGEIGLKQYDAAIKLLETKIAQAECFQTKDFQELLDETKRLQKIANQQVEPLKVKANQSLGSSDYKDSIRLYTLALDILPYDETLLSNRATAYLQLRLYAEALADTEKALATNPQNKKASLCYAKALFGLKKDKEASRFLEALSRVSNSSIKKECNRLLKKSREVVTP